MQLGTKNISDIERGVVGISVSTLKRICERLPVSSDTLLFGSEKQNDIAYLTEKLQAMPPHELALLNDLISEIFRVFALLQS